MFGALLLSAAGPAESEAVPIRIAPVRSTIAASAEVGKRGAGWTCFPAGAIRWRDLSFDAAVAAETIARALSAQGIAADAGPLGELAPATGTLVTATIRAAQVKACTPQHGIGKLLGGTPKLKGRVTLAVAWSVRRGGLEASMFETHDDAELSTKNADLGALLEAGLSRAARDAVDDLKAVPLD